MGELSKNELVRKGNQLMDASYRLGVLEQKVIISVASLIKKNDPPYTTYTISVKEFSEWLGVKPNSKYQELRQITLNLMKKVFEIKIDNVVIQVAWLAYVAYHEKEGTIDVQFAPFLKEYLFGLQKNFTTYEKKNIAKLKKSSSIRMYELLKRFVSFQKERTFELEDLKEKLGISGETYDIYANFKLRILKSAQKELKEKTDIEFDFKEIKKSRKVVAIKFIIHVQETKDVIEVSGEPFKEVDGREIIREMLLKTGLDVKKETLDKWMEYGFERTKEILEYAINPKNKVRNPIGFIVWALEQQIKTKDLKTAKGRKELIPQWLEDEKQEEETHQEKTPASEISIPGMTQEEIEELERMREFLKEELKQYKK